MGKESGSLRAEIDGEFEKVKVPVAALRAINLDQSDAFHSCSRIT